MRIITISRQFGSGGRELGKRLSDALGWDYYDREIIEELSRSSGMDPERINTVLGTHGWESVHLTYRQSFKSLSPASDARTALLVSQRKIIEGIAAAGNDCIIVGRDADIILAEYRPFRIFVCAEMETRLARCMKHERKLDGDQLTEKEILRNIKRIDRGRSQVRELLTGKKWGDPTGFDLSVNTCGKDIRQLVDPLAEYALRWFEEK